MGDVRFAASPEVLDAIARHYQTDGVPPAAADHLAAETVAHPGEMDTRIELFQQIYDVLLSKGYSPEMAQHLAVEYMETGENPQPSVRYQMEQGVPAAEVY